MSDEFELSSICDVKSEYLRSFVVSLMKESSLLDLFIEKFHLIELLSNMLADKGMKGNPIEGVVLPN